MNEIKKSFDGAPIKADAAQDISLLNQYALRELNPDEVFAFAANLCDDQVDRDQEAFSVRSLKKMQRLFLGKPLITDHAWSAKNQAGRIYRTELVRDGNVTRLRASIYTIRTAGTEETINLIEGGILREVSVSCSMGRCTCSACGEDLNYNYLTSKRECKNGHAVGNIVNGKTVHCVLEDPKDAFEVSLVAVPAQREAGITKSANRSNELSDEEWAKRRRIFESSLGCTITDEIWAAIKAGKISSVEVAAAHKKQADSEKTFYSDYVPDDDFSGTSIRFVMIPDSVIDKSTRIASYRALGFCRKELELQPIRITWFATYDDAQRLGLDLSAMKKFYNSPKLLGTASRKNPNLIVLRYPQANAGIMKTIFHECWHAFQMKDEYNTMDEDNAYWYMDDAYKRYCALSEEDKERLFYDELLMKDYRTK